MSGRSMQEGAIIMVICEFTAAILALFGGIVLDNFYKFFGDAGIFNDIPIQWQSQSQVLSAINLYYLACVVLAIGGILIFVQTVYQREGVDTTRYMY